MERKLTKREQKKQQQYQERRQRMMNAGVSEEKVDQIIAQEDYFALPTDKKFQRLEAIIAQSFREIGKDIEALRHNDMMIADAMDINMRSMSKCLEKAGVPLEEQKAVIEEVQKELAEEYRKKQEAAETEKLKEVLGKEAAPDESAPVSIPEEATVFGG